MDKFEVALENKLKELKECQESHKFNSCNKCDEFFSCILRADYVKSVYASMSKDGTGGFNF